ncbi:transcriptional regulator [Plantactinospora sp. BC1]|uniref:transcriptional regulator n=1 Tax=Plantactinospora sp. BC1 TaxID=2108470 RepID=UPI000D152823|nr:transcriptional regulator [Plantactinospora sp. BC1]AVT30872.1 transcriptional regulator [Plantactinospora sp. BC1]
MYDVDPYFGPLLRRPRQERGLSVRALAQLVDATDVSAEVLSAVELAVDDLASAYATSPPGELLDPIRQQLARIGRLLDARATLDQRRRLLVAGGWLSLLRATVHIDLRHRAAATAHLAIAEQLAQQTEHREIQAWCLETVASDVLTAGDYRRALNLSRQAQEVAPRDSSAYIQATAQEGRAWARIGDQRETRRTLSRLSRLVSPLPVPDRPEHHYRYDPAKALSYTATTLAWAGEPAAEDYARAAVAELNGSARPRRTASARLDLGLALVAAGKPDEASVTAQAAITSGRVVASNWWRASEVVASVEATGISEARDLRDAYEAYRPLPE